MHTKFEVIEASVHKSHQNTAKLIGLSSLTKSQGTGVDPDRNTKSLPFAHGLAVGLLLSATLWVLIILGIGLIV
jgi:hypothetical protein